MILTIIVVCEIGFWLLVGLGLLARYALNLRRVGLVLLAMTPVVDLVLLAAVLISLSNGETATFLHGLAALYLGASVAYGHKMISWADARVAHRYGRGRAPGKLYGTAYTRECWQDVARTTLAVGIAAAIIWLLVALVDDRRPAEHLRDHRLVVHCGPDLGHRIHRLAEETARLGDLNRQGPAGTTPPQPQ